MADIKWSAFPDGAAITSGDEVVGLRAGANVRLTANTFDNLNLDTNTISSVDTDGNLILTPDGTGDLVLDGLNWPQADGSANTVLTTDGAGQLSWTTASFPATAGATGTVLRSNGTNYVASTSTFADTYGASTLLYSNGANTVTGLATANNGLLVTSAAGVPSIGNTIGDSISVSATSNAVLRYLVKNSSNGTAAESQLRIENDVSGGGVRLLGSGYTAIPSYTNRMLVYGDSGVTGGILIRTTSASGGIQLTADNSINNPNLLVDSSGNTSMDGLLTVTTGINFGQDTLNYYDEGTFTPTFTFATVGDLGVSYATQVGTYTRTGNRVNITVAITCTPTYTSASGVARISGLPVAGGGSVIQAFATAISGANTDWRAGGTSITAAVVSSATYAQIYTSGPDTVLSTLTTTNIDSGVAITIYFAGTYLV